MTRKPASRPRHGRRKRRVHFFQADLAEHRNEGREEGGEERVRDPERHRASLRARRARGRARYLRAASQPFPTTCVQVAVVPFAGGVTFVETATMPSSCSCAGSHLLAQAGLSRCPCSVAPHHLTPAVPYLGPVANICENPHRRNNAKRPWGTAFDSAPIIATTAWITPSRGCSSITF